MSKSMGLINKRDVLKVIKDAKGTANKSIDDFYFIRGDKNTIKGLPIIQQREIVAYIGNKKVSIILWRS